MASQPTHAYVAYDVGAESGRCVLGTYRNGLMSTRELHRFPNEPVQYNGGLHWDVARLWLEIQKALSLVAADTGANIEGIGVDTWGLDYALLGENGILLENPYQYRDKRTDGVMEKVFAVLPREEIYARTGIQFMRINTLYQLFAAFQETPKLFPYVEKLITIPDLFNFWMTGEPVSEFTNATTTQLYDPRRRRWSTEIFTALGLPTHMLVPIIEPGSIIGHLLPEVSRQAGLDEVPVIAPACHDTGSAVAAIESADSSVFISSGTWSLLGTEIAEPLINSEAQQLNFTNEGGVGGTFRLLKNIMGLWLLQSCRRDWACHGREYSYGELLDGASSTPAFRSLVDPDHPTFLSPEDMPESLVRFCRATEQPEPETPPAFARAILESLALKYRYVLELLENLTGRAYKEIHIVGGGAKNRLLNQFTADATGRTVIAGPVEATALGNIGVQMLGTGAVRSLRDVRSVIARSFPNKVFEPHGHELWDQAYTRFRHYCSPTIRPIH